MTKKTPPVKKARSLELIVFRLTAEEKKRIKKFAREHDAGNVSDFIKRAVFAMGESFERRKLKGV